MGHSHSPLFRPESKLARIDAHAPYSWAPTECTSPLHNYKTQNEIRHHCMPTSHWAPMQTAALRRHVTVRSSHQLLLPCPGIWTLHTSPSNGHVWDLPSGPGLALNKISALAYQRYLTYLITEGVLPYPRAEHYAGHASLQ